MNRTSDELLVLFDNAPLNRRFWITFILMSAVGQTANGVGKVLDPLSLALIAGTSHLVSPQQTSAAVLPAFLFLAFCMALVGLSFLLLRVETHGKAMVLDHGAAR
jgi:hypothetical protein